MARIITDITCVSVKCPNCAEVLDVSDAEEMKRKNCFEKNFSCSSCSETINLIIQYIGK
jgi:hypothetical protein